MTPTLFTTCNTLNVTARDSQSLRSVQPRTGGLGAAELSPEGAVIAWGGPALHTL
jgi:hypothetical protein